MAQDLTDKGKPFTLSDAPMAGCRIGNLFEASYSHAEAKDTDSLIQAIGAADDGSGIAGLVWAIGSILLKPLAALGEEDFIETYRLSISARLWRSRA